MVSGIVTAILLVFFIAGWIWAWSPKRQQAFEAASRLPLDDQEPVANDTGNRNQEQAS
ncbi:CcoQ/FixQ family Cbb3-type cytochrome c oxidase assembly chaperone [Lysobacteraceae bacterium NML120232]|nr:CcoQ/FixQ family Cbb3-type cytochrome c oxidase assembly chaperone [Xanthomonadaceae bacterium NML08-0793]PJK12063.1 CcoQ/FixQ family Cbb3-type cytochrome c oxidase assembly chaperone [Xanthomonadaceae bacterium NML120232]